MPTNMEIFCVDWCRSRWSRVFVGGEIVKGLQTLEFQHKNQNMVGFQTVGLIPVTKFSITHLCNLRKLQRLKTPTEKSQMVVWSGILPHWLRKLPISPQKRFGKSQVISPVLRFALFFPVQYWFKSMVFSVMNSESVSHPRASKQNIFFELQWNSHTFYFIKMKNLCREKGAIRIFWVRMHILEPPGHCRWEAG